MTSSSAERLDRSPVLLTKMGAVSTGPISVGTGGLPAVLLEKVPGRLRLLSLLLLGVMAVSWIGVNLVEGDLLAEFAVLHQWTAPVAILVAAAVVLWLSRRPAVAPETMVHVGLAFQVLVSWSICMGSYWGAFADLPADFLTSDRVGLSPVVLWMMGYTALVPSRPRSALVALLASAAATPILYAVMVTRGLAPRVSAVDFAVIFVVPYAVCVALSYVMARVIFGLGRDVRRARELGSYRLRDVIGRGGMGEVWRADHAMLARPAAIKLIRPEVLARDADVAMAIARFQREAHITASLQSPHSVELYDFGVSADGTLYYVMELLHGIDLQTAVERHGPLRPARVIHVLRQVCASLAEAHRLGLIHRDIKPANVFLCRWAFEYDFVKVLDFGLAKPEGTPDETGALGVTQANVILGTPAYLAPELATGEQVADGRADLYALGCVAHWLLTGKMVFEAETPMKMAVAHVTRAPSPPSALVDAPLPAGLDEVVLSCLAKNRDGRPADAEALSRRLDAIERTTPWTQEDAERWWREAGLAGEAPPRPSR